MWLHLMCGGIGWSCCHYLLFFVVQVCSCSEERPIHSFNQLNAHDLFIEIILLPALVFSQIRTFHSVAASLAWHQAFLSLFIACLEMQILYVSVYY